MRYLLILNIKDMNKTTQDISVKGLLIGWSYDYIIQTGGTYETLSAVITAMGGATDKTILIKTLTTIETGNITIPARTRIEGLGIASVLGMGGYDFGVPGADTYLYNFKITFADPSSEFINGPLAGNLTIYQMYVDNQSTSDQKQFINSYGENSSLLKIRDLIINLPNKYQCGIVYYISSAGSHLDIDGLTFTGGGANCYQLVILSSNTDLALVKLNNVNIAAILSSSNVSMTLTYCLLSNVSSIDTSVLIQPNRCNISNLMMHEGSSGGYEFNLYSYVNLSLVQRFKGFYTTGNMVSCNLIGCIGKNTDLTIPSGDNFNLFTNCELDQVILQSGADDNGFSNCKLNTRFVVQAGSNRTRMIGCTTDTAISDAGTGTVNLGNTEH